MEQNEVNFSYVIYKLNRARLCVNMAIMIVKLVIGNGPIYTGDGSFVWDEQSTVKNGERTVECCISTVQSNRTVSFSVFQFKERQHV